MTSRNALSLWLVVSVTLAAVAIRQAGGAPAPSCLIAESRGIGPVQLGMPAAQALAAAGGAIRQQTSVGRTVYTLRPPLSEIVVEGGSVVRVSTQSAQCRTARGLGPGGPAAGIRGSYPDTPVSAVIPIADGEVVTFPFVGIAFVVRAGRVAAVDVFRAEGVPPPGPASVPSPTGPAPAPGASPSPTPTATTAPGSWGIRSLTGRMDGLTLVVTGVVENRGAAQSVYAEIRAFAPGGRQVGQTDAPIAPAPVLSGATATFEVRLPVTEVVRRFTVIIRPVGFITQQLATATGEISERDLQQFAEVVARQLRVEVLTSVNPANRDSFLVVVTNTSSLVVASAVVAVDLTVSCALPPLSPLGQPRPMQETRTGSVTVTQLRPGASARATLPISPGACVDFATWSAQTRVGQVVIAPE